MKKNQTSLVRRILSLLLVILLVTVAVTTALRYLSIRKEGRVQAAQMTQLAANQAAQLLDPQAVKAALTDAQASQALTEQLRQVCLRCGLEYLYLYIPDLDAGTATYVAAAAADEAMHQTLSRERSAGTVVELSPEVLAVNDNAWNGRKPVSLRFENEYGDVASSFALLSDGAEKVALVGADANAQALSQRAFTELWLKTGVSLLAFLLAFFLVGSLTRRRIIDPILTIANRMQTFTVQVESEEFAPLDLKTGDEIEAVAQSFNTMAAQLTSYIQKVKDLAAEEAKLSTELDVARRIQYGVVAARTELALPNGRRLLARMLPARSVGGDFYDHFDLPDGRRCILIGDVSGKGVGAAMFMMLTKAVLHEKLMACPNMAQAMAQANDALCENNPETMFVTVFAAVIDEGAQKLYFVNAGHNAPILVQDGTAACLPVRSGIALGLFDEMIFTQQSVDFFPTNTLLLYTDGVTECTNEEEAFWGTAPLLELLGKETCDPCEAVLEALRAFQGQAEQFDDITMLCVTGPKEDL